MPLIHYSCSIFLLTVSSWLPVMWTFSMLLWTKRVNCLKKKKSCLAQCPKGREKGDFPTEPLCPGQLKVYDLWISKVAFVVRWLQSAARLRVVQLSHGKGSSLHRPFPADPAPRSCQHIHQRSLLVRPFHTGRRKPVTFPLLLLQSSENVLHVLCYSWSRICVGRW